MLSSDVLLNNPLCIQQAILKDYEAKLDGESVVVDANNSFMFLVEAFSRVVSEATNAMDTKLSGLYPIRANTTNELYNHLSDFDYVGFFSYPASLKLSIMLHRDYLIKHAVKVPDTNYKLVVIPADTIFSIGRFKLGLYYPIHIKINTIINSISASYDTTEINPLKSLATNNLEVRANNFEGVDLISIEFDTYQFDKTVFKETINPEIGFIKRYKFDNKFYAIRIFDIGSGEKKELAYTMSDSVYDLERPTANLKVYPETNEIGIYFPQVYFTSNKLSRQIQVELFSTIGELDASLANLKLSDITANFSLSSPNTALTYTNILKNIPTVVISPMANRIVGGSNSFTFKQMKDYTVYHNNSFSVPITRMDLERFFARNGFKYMPKIDNLTDRRYYAYRKLYMDDLELGVTCGGLTLPYLTDTPRQDVIYQNDDTIVILPTAIYRYIPTIKKFEILTDDAEASLTNAAGNQLVQLINNEHYFCNPHHVVVSTADRYPACTLYDLLTTEVTNITFLEENIYLSAQLSVTNVVIRHMNNGAGGYIVRAAVRRSEELKDVDPSELNCYLTINSKTGYRVGVRGTFVSKYGELDLYDFALETNYRINEDKITLTNLRSNNGLLNEYEVLLSGVMQIATFVKKSRYPDVAQDTSILNYLTVDDNSWLGVSLQSFDYSLGSDLSDVLDTNILTNWTNVTYQTYEVDVPLTYEHDVYELNTDGTLKYSIDPITNAFVLNKLHAIGDVVYSDGEIVYKHRATDTIVDINGNPLPVASRMKDFTFALSAFEYSQRLIKADFLEAVAKDLRAYYETIREMNLSVLENTDIYFRPIVTTSTGRYKINNNTTIESSLELEFEFNCYVSQAVMDDDNMIKVIEDRIHVIIADNVSSDILSLTEIANSIKSELVDYLISIDTITLNGSGEIQTLVNVEIDKSPKMGMRLAIGRDGVYEYVPKVKINFKPLDV